MFKRIRTGLLCMVLAAASTVAIAQSFTTFVNARVVTQLDLQGQLTANGSTGTIGQALTSNGAGDVTWSTVAGGVTGLANPTGTIGLTAVNGVATTAPRSDSAPALSQAIAPTWTAGHIFGLARTNATAPLLLSSTTTALRFFETDATANNTRWEWAVNGEQLRLALLDDTGTLTGTAMLIDRTAGTVDSIAFAATGITFNGIDYTDFARLSQSNTFTGNTQAISNTSSTFVLNETDGTANNRRWDFRTQADQLAFRVVDDAVSAATNWLTVDRTLNVVDSIGLAATAVTTTASSIVSAGTHSFTTNGANARFDGNDPRFLISESDAAADSKNWLTRSAGSTYAISVANDAAPFSAIADAFNIQRSGTSVGVATFNGTNFVNAGNGVFLGSSSAPRFSLNETDGAVDNRLWRIGTSAETLVWGTRNDADNTGVDFLEVDRTGTTVDSIELNATTTILPAAASAASALRVGTTGATNLGYDIAAVRNGNARIGVFNDTDNVEGMMLAQAAAEGVVYGALTDHRVVIRQNNDDRIEVTAAGAIEVTGNTTVTGKTTSTNGVTATAGVNSGNRFSVSTQSPTSLAATTHNWALTPVPVVLITASTTVSITGIDATTANADAQSLGNNAILHLINTSSSKLTLAHESASSTAANRFSLPNNQPFGIASNASVSVYYDTVVSRWRPISAGVSTEVFAFTLNFTNGCTTTPTMLMSAAKFGNVVSMRINGSMSSCTGDATSFGTSADVPTELRPDANSCFAMGNSASDNGLAVSALFCIQTDGTVVIQECPLDGVAGFGCASGTWLASGTRFLGGLSLVFTYNLDQS